MLHKSDKGVMGWKNNEQSYKIIVHKHTSTYHKRHTVNAKKKKLWQTKRTALQQQCMLD